MDVGGAGVGAGLCVGVAPTFPVAAATLALICSIRDIADPVVVAGGAGLGDAEAEAGVAPPRAMFSLALTSSALALASATMRSMSTLLFGAVPLLLGIGEPLLDRVLFCAFSSSSSG
jgi:hypothetical protein